MFNKTFSESAACVALRPSYDYVISGLTVRSAVELPSAISSAELADAPEVVIQPGVVPESLDGALRSGPSWQVSTSTFLLTIPHIGRFQISNGSEIRFEAAPRHDPGDLALYLIGTCFAILLQQRGNFVLHASAVLARGRAMLFCGPSGAGKSTMAAMLCSRGYSLINDDVCNLSRTAKGDYVVKPDGRMLKLWAATLDHLDLSGQRGEAVRQHTDKFYLVPPSSDKGHYPVGCIYVLTSAEEGESDSLLPLDPVDAMAELSRNAYRPALVSAMGQQPAYFQTSAALYRNAGVFRLIRHMDFSSADSVIRLLESHWIQKTGPNPGSS